MYKSSVKATILILTGVCALFVFLFFYQYRVWVQVNRPLIYKLCVSDIDHRWRRLPKKAREELKTSRCTKWKE